MSEKVNLNDESSQFKAEAGYGTMLRNGEGRWLSTTPFHMDIPGRTPCAIKET